MAEPTTQELKSRRSVAKSERDSMQPLIDEAFDYAIPYRRSTAQTGRGEKRVDKAFDQTAVVAAFRFSGKLQQDLLGDEFFKLELGPIGKMFATRDGSLEQTQKQLEAITGVVQALFDDGEWDQAFIEMALDLTAGTGAMMILEGDDAKPVRYVCAPIDEVLLEPGPYNDVGGIFWSRKWPVRAISQNWPDAVLGPDLAQLLAEKPESEIEIHQDTIWDPADKKWRLTVWCEKQDEPLHRSESLTCPWITPRYFRVPGETMGRGPTMLAMPTIKTLNTAQRLQLQAAAIAMMGIYTAIDDGVFNPDQAAIEPGIFWKVSRNGGSQGPAVQRFPDPRLDLSQLVLTDLRMGVQAAMMDQSLPADGAAVRSATEILERVKRLASDNLGAFGRLVREIIIPAVRRVIELAYRRGLIAQNVAIDQLLVRISISSPIAVARKAQKSQKIIQWLEMVIMLLQERAGRVAHVEEILIDLGQEWGVPLDRITTKKERATMDQQEQEAAAAAALAAGLTGKPVPA